MEWPSLSNWWKSRRSNSASPSTVWTQDSDSQAPSHSPKASVPRFWSRLGEILHPARVRELERELVQEREARLLLEGQLTATRSQLDWLREQVVEAQRNERTLYQTGVNAQFQTKYGIAPFPDAPKIPDSLTGFEMPTQIEPDYVDMRARQQQLTSEFFEKGRQLRAEHEKMRKQ